VSYWLLTYYGGGHLRVALPVLLEMLCGDWSLIVFDRILQGVTGYAFARQYYRQTRKVRVVKRNDVIPAPDDGPSAARLPVRFRADHALWPSQDSFRRLLRRRRLKVGIRLKGWRPPTDRFLHGWNERRR
jgi:hypothetical protein